jgi:hypothetical protein
MDLFREAVGAISLSMIVLAPPAMAQTSGAANGFTLASPSFKDGGDIALRYGGNNPASPNCLGQNVSPPLQWSGAPVGTKSFALILVDLHGRVGAGITHWVAYGIPAAVNGFAEGEVSTPSDKFVRGKGMIEAGTYLGPCPPAGPPRHYAFTLIATDLDPTALPPGLTREELLSKLVGHGKDAAVLIGLASHR